MSFLDKITGKWVLRGGIAIAAIADYFFPTVSRIVVGGLLAFALLLDVPKIDALLHRLLGSFAEVPAWPRFVALGVASLFAAHVGGGRGIAEMIGLLTAMDGNVFEALY